MNSQPKNTRRTARRILSTVACAAAVLSLAACEESFEPNGDEAKAAELAPVPAPAVSAHNAVSERAWEQIGRVDPIDIVPALAFDPTAPIDPREQDAPSAGFMPNVGSTPIPAPAVSADDVVAEDETWTVAADPETIDMGPAQAFDPSPRMEDPRFDADVEMVVYVVDNVRTVAPRNHTCGDMLVLPLADVCDGEQDCTDESDEIGCR